MKPPSVTNTFFTSCIWFHLLSTEVLGSCPMRAVPISWIPIPGIAGFSNDLTSFSPAASRISAASFFISMRILRSFSPNSQSIASNGSPHLSFFVKSRKAWFLNSGKCSPKEPRPIVHGPGSVISSLKPLPKPISGIALCHPVRLALPP